MRKAIAPEIISRVLDELDEGDEKAPGMWAVDNEPFEEHPGDLLLNDLGPQAPLEAHTLLCEHFRHL